MKLAIISFIFLFSFSICAKAQVSSYSFWSFWGNYSEITTGTTLGSGASLDDNSYNAIDIGFPFVYNGNTYTHFSVNANGFIAMGTSVSSSYVALSLGTTNNVISADCHNLQGTATAVLSYELDGTPGNRVLTIQWKDFKQYNIYEDIYNFQIRLEEASNEIDFVFGNFVPVHTLAAQVGLRGESNADFNNRLTTNNWAATTAGTTNTAPCYLGSVTFPALGLTYCFKPVVAGNPGFPLNPGPSNISSNIPLSGSLNWTFGANSTTYDLWFGPKVNLQKVIDNQTITAGSGSYSYSMLNTSTTYQWQVIEHNANGTVNGPVWSFTTLCGLFTIPFAESFDSYSPTSVGCGTILNSNNDAVKWETRTGLTYSGFNRLHIGYNPAGQPHNDWYITPGLILTGMQTYEVKFYYKGGASSYVENLEVKWGNSPTVPGMSSPPIFSDLSFYKPNYVLATAYFTPTATGTYYLGWHCFSLGDQFSVEVDQITVNITSTCIPPSDLSVSNVSGSSADISWTGNSSNARIAYGPTGFDPGSGTAFYDNSGSGNYTVSGLSPSTSYDVYIQQNCGTGIYSGWAGPLNFSTSPDALKTLSLKLYLQGLYAGSGMMNKAQGDAGDQFPGNTADVVTIELHNTSTGVPEYSSTNVNLSTSGMLTVAIPSSLNGSYYIYIKHRNSVVIATASPVSFSGNSIVYDFSTGISQAYGDNMKSIGEYALIYGGDVNEDGTVDAGDMTPVDNDNSLYATGYLATDVNGDGLIDSADMTIIENNAGAYVSAVIP